MQNGSKSEERYSWKNNQDIHKGNWKEITDEMSYDIGIIRGDKEK